jgi:hypothetical protein
LSANLIMTDALFRERAGDFVRLDVQATGA